MPRRIDRTNRTRLTAVCLAALAATWSLAACGIPTGAAPEVIDDAPTDFDSASGGQVEEFLPDLDATTTVQNFLKAASGDPTSREDRLNVFAPEHDEPFSDPAVGIGLLDNAQVTLHSDENPEIVTVTVTGSVIGTYLLDGSVRMNTAPRDYNEDFVLHRTSFQENWLITELPSQVVLDYDQFKAAYEQAPLYFQATGQTGLLVPDLRWIYRQLDEGTEHRLRLGWLLQGPSDFVLQTVRNAIPTGTAEQITSGDGTVRIDLTLGETAETAADLIDPITAQIVWSLGIEGDINLTIDGEIAAESTSLDDWRDWNAIPATVDITQTGYYIADDTIWQFENNEVTDASADHPWVGFNVDGLQEAAIGPASQIAAIVTGPGGDVLQTGTSSRNMSTVAGLDGDLSDPQWLDEDTVILIDDGVPTAVDSMGDSVQTLAGENVTALALSADGRRLAYVADGLAWVAPLTLDNDENVQTFDRRRIGLTITDVSDVAWSSEDYLWVAGRQNDDQLFRVAIDNSWVEVQEGTSGFPQIDRIAANPADPVETNVNRGEPVIVVSDSFLYRVHTETLQPIEDGPVGPEIEGSAPFTVLQ